MARIDSFLRLVAEQHASDLHFSAGSPPVIRHHGDLVRIPFRALTDTEARRFLHEILTPEQRATLERDMELDFAYELEGIGRFRTNVFVQNHGVGAVFRIIPERVPTLDELALPQSVRRFTELTNGLVLVTGPTGCGKTTTLAALVNEINRTQRRHVVTIEDPIEYIHAPQQSILSQRQVGRDARSFADGLRSALREAPDVLLVGEMRDLETISLTVQAAETGMLVFGTLHTSSAAKSLDRVVDAYPEEAQDQIRSLLSVILRGVVSQQLCKLASGEGRVAAVEVLLMSFAIANMIRENKVFQIDALLQSAEPGTGMQAMDQALLRLVRERTVALDEALRCAVYPPRLEALAQADALAEEGSGGPGSVAAGGAGAGSR